MDCANAVGLKDPRVETGMENRYTTDSALDALIISTITVDLKEIHACGADSFQSIRFSSTLTI